MPADMLNEADTKAKVFISYSRKDQAFVDRLDAALKSRGFEPLIDRAEIYAFEDWWERIQSLITQADTIIFVLSPDAVTSDICKKEVEFAALLNKRFAPVIRKHVDDNAVPASLRRFNYIFCDDDAQFEARMNLLAEALSTDIEWIRKHTEFGALARRWETAGRPGPRGLLLRSPMLEDAERWIALRPPGGPEPTPTTRAFIADSRRATTQRRVQATASAVGITLVVGLSATAWFKRETLMQRWDVWRNALSTDAEQALEPKQEFRECSRCPLMVVVPAGEFLMGSPETEDGRHQNEGPQHKVLIAKPFAVGKFEVTFDEWDACVALAGCKNYRPADRGFGRGNRPVMNVSWNEAKEYVNWLSKLTGKRYRLLSEAEWEYAARAGSTTAYSWGDEIKKEGKAMANCDGCGSQWDDMQTAPVGSFPANAFGLHDMHGNVWEWVEDCHGLRYDPEPTDGSVRIGGPCHSNVVRGGSWNVHPGTLRSANRMSTPTDHRDWMLGFRVARTLLTP